MKWQHMALLVNNRPGVLSHVAGLIARRNINIECLNVGYTEIPEISRINLVVGVESRVPAGPGHPPAESSHRRNQGGEPGRCPSGKL